MARTSTTRARRARAVAVPGLLAGAVLAVLTLALLVSHRDARRDLEARFAERTTSTAALTDALLRTTAEVSARALAARHGRASIDDAELEADQLRDQTAYAVLAQEDGRVIAATRHAPAATAARAGRDADRLGRPGAPAYLLHPVTDAAGRPILEIAIPFRSGGRRLVHVAGISAAVWSEFFGSALDRAWRPVETRAAIVDAGGRVYWVSGRAARFPDAFAAHGAIGSSPLKLVYETSREQLYAPIDGKRRWVGWFALAVAALAMGGGMWLLVRLRRSHLALRRSEERYALALRAANDALWDWDLQTGHVHYSERWDELAGPSRASGVDRWLDRVHPEDRPALEAAIDAHLAGRSPILDHEHRLRAATGDWMWALVRGLAVFDERGRGVRMAGSLSDITSRRRALEHLEHQATHDPLTGLANRAHFFSVLERSLERARRGDHAPCAVVFLDLDGFKQVNDSYGHVFGDAVLSTVGARLQHAVRPGDVVGRLGGDELAVLLPHCDSFAEARAVAERLAEALRAPYEVLGESIRVSASAGVAVAAPDETAEELLREADAAMYRAKLAV